MLIPITIKQNPDGTIDAAAPALPGCEVRGQREEIGLPTLRLLIEDALTVRLLEERALPAEDVGASIAAATTGTTRHAHVNINVGHLVALAKHQRDK
jgi:hypothetical protein